MAAPRSRWCTPAHIFNCWPAPFLCVGWKPAGVQVSPPLGTGLRVMGERQQALGGELGHNGGGRVQAKIRPSSCNQWCMRRSGTGSRFALSSAADGSDERRDGLLSGLSQLALFSALFSPEMRPSCGSSNVKACTFNTNKVLYYICLKSWLICALFRLDTVESTLFWRIFTSIYF